MSRSAILSTRSSAPQFRSRSVLKFPAKNVDLSTSKSAPVCPNRSVPLCSSKSALVEEAIQSHMAQAGEGQGALMMDFCLVTMALPQANPKGRSQDMARGQLILECIFLMRTVMPARGQLDQG